ncbi:hypothetical protein LAZ67_8000217 [Cordylochernes scorpioides]|uniref:Uncharacterized protein n=1 Tax=Cordylochernes scorpioides TaxID=51811 RepID=A0ABY6KR53_9ARAC|nr:hypothetical protein LAZ67_8000217 [Cordylochernes scorpioides]
MNPKQTTNLSQPHSSSHPPGASPTAPQQPDRLSPAALASSAKLPTHHECLQGHTAQDTVAPPPLLARRTHEPEPAPFPVEPMEVVHEELAPPIYNSAPQKDTNPRTTPKKTSRVCGMSQAMGPPSITPSPSSGSAPAATAEDCSVVNGQSTPAGPVAPSPAENTRAQLQEYPAPSLTHGAGKTRQQLEILLGQVPSSYLTEAVQLGLQIEEVKSALTSEPALRSLKDCMTAAQKNGFLVNKLLDDQHTRSRTSIYNRLAGIRAESRSYQ